MTTLTPNIKHREWPASLGVGPGSGWPGPGGGALVVRVQKATSTARAQAAHAEASAQSDHALVERVVSGDVDAFAGILARHQHRIYSIAANFAHNSDDAADLAQEVFLKAYRALPRFRGQSAFSTWLYRIAVNACVDYTRRRARAGLMPLTDDILAAPRGAEVDPHQEIERAEQRAALMRAVGSLSVKLRATLILHDIEGLTHEEIGRILGCSVGTTKSRLFRARQEVRRHLREQAEGELK